MIRRALLARLLGELAATVPLGGMASGESVGLRELLLGLTGDAGMARALGRQYLAALHDPTGLARAVVRLRGLALGNAGARRAAIGSAATHGLATGEVVVVGGWVLARAEAETLALIALT
jgi:hypothetical protein